MRRTAIPIVCLAVIVILSATGYYYLRSKPGMPLVGGAAPSLITLLPQQAPFVIYADVAALRKSEFLEHLISLAPAPVEDPDYAQFVQATGFDYARDLDRVGIAIEPDPQQTIVETIADGHFDQQKITAYALRNGKTEQRDGRTVYVVPQTGGGEMTLSFLSPSRIELDSFPKGERTANRAAAKDETGAEAMQERIKHVAGSTVFAVARMDAIPKNAVVDSVDVDQIASYLQDVRWLSLAAAPEGQNLRVMIDGKCDSVVHAAKLQLAVQGLRFLGNTMLKQSSVRKQFTSEGAAALTTLLGQIDVSRNEQSVVLSAAFTPDLLNGLAAPTPPQKQTAPAKTPANAGKPSR